jgi:hypothetical protein
MAVKRKTWVWILVISVSVCVVALVAMMVAVGYFFGRNVQVTSPSRVEAFRQFDSARAPFKDQKPLFEFDNRDHPRLSRTLSELPTASVKPRDLVVMAWDPDGRSPGVGKLVRIPLPFWLLKMGRQKIDLMPNDSGVELDQLNLDINELERVGPMLVIDFRTQQGKRVLVWTQ